MSQSSGPTTSIQEQQSLDTNHQSIYYQSLTPPPHQQQSGFYSTLSPNQPQQEISYQNVRIIITHFFPGISNTKCSRAFSYLICKLAVVYSIVIVWG